MVRQVKISGLLKRHRQVLLAVGIVLIAALIMFVLIKMRKRPAKLEQAVLAPLVRTEVIESGPVQMIIKGYGTVTPKTSVEIVPQVAGKVVWVNPAFRPGRVISGGERIFQIDPKDYELKVEELDASVEEAKVKLYLEKAEAEVAKAEWEQLNPGQTPKSPLVLRVPQVKQAEARLDSAKAALAVAKLNLERTNITLPVDALIIEERVDVGQYVVVGQTIGRAYGTDAVEIEVPLEDKELAWFDLPQSAFSFNGNGLTDEGDKVEVRANFAGRAHIWDGQITRTTGQVDPRSRLVSIVVEVDDPFNPIGHKPALLPGTFVEVAIEGRTVENVAMIPRDAVREGDKLWVVNDGRLHINELNILRSDEDYIYAVGGVDKEARVVISSLDVVADGMKVRTQAEPGELEGGADEQ